MKSTQHGLSMIELISVVSIVGILLVIGVPSYRYVITSNRVSAEVNGLLMDMQFARSEAIKEAGPSRFARRSMARAAQQQRLAHRLDCVHGYQ